jgi:putative ABC transport system permease protein
LRHGQPRAADPAAQARVSARIRELAGQYRDAIAGVPRVKQVAIADRAPFSEFAVMFMTTIDGYTPATDAPQPPLSASGVTADYFNVLGQRLTEGRYLAESDGDGAPLVAVVNEAFVRRFFPGESVLGRRLASPTRPGEWVTIVGVVADTRRNSFDNDPVAQVYFPLAQWPQPRLAALVSYSGDRDQVAAAVLERLRRLRPDQAFDMPVSLEEKLDRMLAPRRLVMNLLASFAGIAVLLAATGIFGVMAYAVAQRTHEFGVRMALGADRTAILRHVLVGAGLAVGIGVIAGILLAVGSSRLLQAGLFGVGRYDPAILGGAALTLTLTGLVAALVPALRAARVDPAVALRAE